jgi:hypothetical protein
MVVRVLMAPDAQARDRQDGASGEYEPGWRLLPTHIVVSSGKMQAEHLPPPAEQAHPAVGQVRPSLIERSTMDESAKQPMGQLAAAPSVTQKYLPVVLAVALAPAPSCSV